MYVSNLMNVNLADEVAGPARHETCCFFPLPYTSERVAIYSLADRHDYIKDRDYISPRTE